VIDGDTLDVNGTRVRLADIDAPEHGQSCQTSAGQWSCGNSATQALTTLVVGRQITCDQSAVTDSYDRLIATCFADGQNLGEAMVIQGHAWAFLRYSDTYAPQEAIARENGTGIWQAPTETPWDFRARRWRAAQEAAPEGCPIKGNISANGRIYHPPWSPWYSRTRINLAKGERWFCDEAEAIAAGWRAPNWQ